MDGHEDAAHAHDRRGDQHGAADVDQVLDLPDVVRAARQQGWRAESLGLALGEGGDVFEDRLAQVAAEAHARPRAEVDGADRAQHLQPGDREHHHAEPDDGGGVALGDALVDDRRVDRGQVQRGQGAGQLEHQQHRNQPPVRPDVLAQQCQEHLVTVAYGARRGPYHRREMPAQLPCPWLGPGLTLQCIV